MELKQRQYGELDTKEHIPGAEALLEERKLKPDGTLVSSVLKTFIIFCRRKIQLQNFHSFLFFNFFVNNLLCFF
jgi:hypothetical protein